MGHRPSKDALYDGPASVAKALGSGRRAGLVDVNAQGERRVDDLAVEIGLTTAHAANVDQLAEAYLGDRSDGRGEPRPAPRPARCRRCRARRAPAGRLRGRHVAGAINTPAKELAEHLRQLPDGKQIVAYRAARGRLPRVGQCRPTNRAG